MSDAATNRISRPGGLNEREPQAAGTGSLDADASSRSLSPQTRQERIRILDEYAELNIEAALRGPDERWGDLGREW